MNPKNKSCLVCGCHIAGGLGNVRQHIIDAHPIVSKNLKLDVNPLQHINECGLCGKYTLWKHFHCLNSLCRLQNHYSWHTRTAVELHEHLRTVHPLSGSFFMEFICTNGKDGIDCHGRVSGACCFNHGENIAGKDRILYSTLEDGTFVETLGGCRNEKSGTERCTRKRCRFNHGRGRAKWVIGQQNKMDAAATNIVAIEPVIDDHNVVDDEAVVIVS